MIRLGTYIYQVCRQIISINIQAFACDMPEHATCLPSSLLKHKLRRAQKQEGWLFGAVACKFSALGAVGLVQPAATSRIIL